MKRKLIKIITALILPVLILCGCEGEELPEKITKSSENTTIITSVDTTLTTETATESVITTTAATTTSETVAESTAENKTASAKASDQDEELVWIPASGTKYHKNASCSNMKDPRQITRESAEASGYTPCKKCCK